jgi:hypothetical protein
MPTCPCCQGTLPLGGAPAAANDDENTHDDQPFTFGTVLEFCDPCADLVNSKIETEGLHFFVSHIVPEHVSWSSHPDLVTPSPKPFALTTPQLSSPSCGDGGGGDDDVRATNKMLELAARALTPPRSRAPTESIGANSTSGGSQSGSGSGRGSSGRSSATAVASATSINDAGAAANDDARARGPLRVLVVAGAGMSCVSGLPDFRGKQGFYRVGGGQEVRMEQINFHDEEAAFPPDCDIRLTWWCVRLGVVVAAPGCCWWRWWW